VEWHRIRAGYHLTPREIEVALCLTVGASRKAIARHLSLGARTVRVHVEGLFHKLAVNVLAQVMVSLVHIRDQSSTKV
jgi:DNA-binding NarL/FixJ family response regulator